MIGICTYEGILKIKDFLRENELDNKNIEVVISIDNGSDLKTINEYYSNIFSPGNLVKENELTEVNINLGSVNFKYKLSEHESEDNQ